MKKKRKRKVSKKDAAYIKEAFLEALTKADVCGKKSVFCKELLKLQDSKELSGISFDTLCYLALVNCKVDGDI